MPTVLVDELADVRAGDKGATLMIAVLPRNAHAFRVLREQLTADAVAQHFGCSEQVTRTILPRLPALTFRLPGVLGGGVTGSAALDGHGKSLGYHLLTLRVPA